MRAGPSGLDATGSRAFSSKGDGEQHCDDDRGTDDQADHRHRSRTDQFLRRPGRERRPCGISLVSIALLTLVPLKRGAAQDRAGAARTHAAPPAEN